MSSETKTIEFQAAQIDEQAKLIRHLEHKNDNLNDRNRNLVEKNDNQVAIIKDVNRRNESQYNDIKYYQDKINEWRRGNEALNQINDEQASVIQANRVEIAGLENRLSDSLVSYETAAKERDQLKAKNLLHTMENVGAVEMVSKIVAAMTDAGFDIAGWGNDDQLTMLENSTASARDHLDDVMAELDAIRTER